MLTSPLDRGSLAGFPHEQARIEHRSRRGVALPLCALLMVAFVALVAFAVDIARMYLVRTQLQSAVDAGALAAALQLRDDPDDVAAAVQAAKNFVQLNQVGILKCVSSDAITVDAGAWDASHSSFTAGKIDADAVRVAARHANEPLFFASMLGIDHFAVPREAVATLGGGKTDIIMILDLSGSMASQGRIEALQSAAPVFVDVIESVGDDDQIAVMGYGAVRGQYEPAAKGHSGVPYISTPQSLFPISMKNRNRRNNKESDWIGVLESPLTSDFQRLRTQVLDSGTLIANKYNGWTPTGAAVRDSANYLSTNGRSDAHKAMVLMSDGHANKPSGNGPGYALEMARYAAGLDIIVYTISLGNGADEQLMEEIAELTGGKHFDATGSGPILKSKLTSAFQRAAGALKGTHLVH